ncbi:ABC transporter permease subunit [Natrialbaceae archaeon GCM10025810]|uniref:ABC transporter permease subunit n=1 Tax=Halovalidus salilacus TaxID=3075124 RepID=UPI00360FAC01
MFETTRYEVRRRRRGTVAFVAGISVVAAFFIALFPAFDTADADLDELIQAYPPAVRDAMGIETISTIEGFLAVELYNFVWLLLLGLYFAYGAAGLIASDVERDRMDLLLSFPVSRARLLAEKVASLLVPILALNVVVGVVVYATVVAVGESIDPASVVAVHALSIPYLLACAGIGLVLSVLVSRADIAKRAAIAIVFVLYLLDSIAASTDGFEWLRYLSPTNYYDPTEILVHETYAYADAGILLVAFLVLVVVAQVLFRRRDI